MSREWKPGDVALICVSRGHGPEVAVSCDQQWFVAGPRLGSQHGWYHDRVEVVRPLVVIDPDDETTLRQIGDLLVAGDRGYDEDSWMDLRDALREFANPTPPKPDEPLGLGAVVEDVDGGLWVKIDEHLKCNDWTKLGAPSHPDPEQAKGESVRWHYTDIAVVRVLSPGYTEDGA